MSKELVTVKVDHQLGSTDDDNPSVVYPINYGYVDRGDYSEINRQYVYIVGVDVAVDEFTGQLIAVARRRDDSDRIWIVAPENICFTKQQLEEMVYFQEQYYDSFIEMLDEEIWDAYDKDGNKLGYELKRSMAKDLPEGVYHVVVMVYTITKAGEILSTQRARNKTYPLKWEVTGGSILSGENERQGAVRELFEETGIKKCPDELIDLYYYVDHKKHCIYYAYIDCIENKREIKLQEGETMDYMYVPYKDFLEFIESDRFVPSEQRRYLKYKQQVMDRLKACIN